MSLCPVSLSQPTVSPLYFCSLGLLLVRPTTLEAATPSVFYWKVIGIVQGLVLGWVLGEGGLREKDKINRSQIFINQYQIHVSAEER